LWKNNSKTWKEWTIGLTLLLSVLYLLKTGADHMFPRALTVPTFVAAVIAIRELEERNYIGLFWQADLSVLVIFFLMGLTTPYSPLRLKFIGERLNFPPDDAQMEKISNHSIRDFQLFFWNKRLNGFDTRKNFPPGNLHEEVFTSQGASGDVSFGYGPGLHNIDPHTLADPLMSHIPQNYDFFVPDHNLRAYPLGYIESVLSKENLIVDSNLKEFYDKVLIITRGPVFTLERLKTVLIMNVGAYQHLIDGYTGKGAIRSKKLDKYIERKTDIAGYDLIFCPEKYGRFDLLCLQNSSE